MEERLPALRTSASDEAVHDTELHNVRRLGHKHSRRAKSLG